MLFFLLDSLCEGEGGRYIARAPGIGGVEAEGVVFGDDLLHPAVDDGVATGVTEFPQASVDGAGKDRAVAQHQADDRLVLVQDGEERAMLEF